MKLHVLAAMAGLATGLAVISAVPAWAGLLGDLNIDKFVKTPDRPAGGDRGDVGVPAPVVAPGAFAFSNGRRLYDAGDYQGALEQFRESLDQTPQDVDVLAWYAACLAKLNWRDEALAQLSAALTRSDVTSQQRANLESLNRDIRNAIWVETSNAGNAEISKMEAQQRAEASAAASRELDRLAADAALRSVEASDTRVVWSDPYR